jgi:hypothetical protein
VAIGVAAVPQCLYAICPSARIHDATIPKTAIFVFTAVRISGLTTFDVKNSVY